MRTLALAAALAAISTTACSSTPKKAAAEQPVRTVADADLGRLGPDEMSALQTARGALHEARDAVARARLRLQESKHEDNWATAEKASAEGDRLRAAAELAAAKEAGDQGRAGLAAERAEAAALRGQAADARLEYARRLVAARDAEVKAAEARARRAEWEVERSKLTALREAGNPAATKYDAAPIDARVTEALRAEQAAQARARELGSSARASFDKWRSLADRYEARAKSIPTG
jgi:hypothetical protein